MFARRFIAVVLLALSGASAALEIACQPSLDAVEKTQLPDKHYARYELSEALSCSWLSSAANSMTKPEAQFTPSVLFHAPASDSPVEIEVGTWLNAGETTATHVALLDQHLQPIQWIPFSAFRERKGYLTARFFVNPADEARYILVGGAASATDSTLTRTYSPLSSNVLRFAGVITAREVNTNFTLVPKGKIRVRIRKSKDQAVPVTR